MSRFRTFWADIARLYREHYWIAVMAWLPWACLVALQRVENALGVASAAAVATLFGQSILSAYALHLERRKEPVDDIYLAVHLDSVNLGVIQESEYVAMRHRATFSVATYLMQLINVAAAVGGLVRWLAIYVPVLLFWTIVLILVSDPAGAAEATRIALTSGQTQPAEFVRGFGGAMLAFALAIAVLFLASSARILGLRSEVRMAWERELRRRLSLPCSGGLELYRIRDNAEKPIDEGQEFAVFLRNRYSVGKTCAVGAAQ